VGAGRRGERPEVGAFCLCASEAKRRKKWLLVFLDAVHHRNTFQSTGHTPTVVLLASQQCPASSYTHAPARSLTLLREGVGVLNLAHPPDQCVFSCQKCSKPSVAMPAIDSIAPGQWPSPRRNCFARRHARRRSGGAIDAQPGQTHEPCARAPAWWSTSYTHQVRGVHGTDNSVCPTMSTAAARHQRLVVWTRGACRWTPS
jgi:hypothetical protein